MPRSIRELTPELAQKAKDELFEDPTRISQDIQALKDWLTKQTHINARTDDQWLVAFLRGSKYSLERAKQKIDLFYTMKSLASEMTVAIDPFEPAMQNTLKKGMFLPIIKNYKPDEPRYLIMKPGLIDTNKASLISWLQAGLMIDYINMMEDDRIIIAGQVAIADMSGMGMAHYSQLTPSLMKKLVLTRQDAFPIRQKGLHHINFPSTAEKVFNLFKYFMSEKMKNRMFIHGDMESLYKVIPKTVLPPEYGGEGDSIQYLTDYWKNKVESYKDWFLDDSKYKTDESKRPGAPKTSESLFGIDGSFRQLNYD